MRKKSLEKTNLDKEAENIIDELINSEDLGMPENETEEIIENVIKQYDIIMECSNSEYIIYYKKDKISMLNCFGLACMKLLII